MDDRFLHYYEQELAFIREMGEEFSQKNPQLASHLKLSAYNNADPHIERLIESFAFLAANIHQRMDSAFPEFTQHLLTLLFPDMLRPTPGAVILQYQPGSDSGLGPEGLHLPVGTEVTYSSKERKGIQDHPVHYSFRTAHPLTIRPLNLSDTKFIDNQSVDMLFPSGSNVTSSPVQRTISEVKSGLMVTLSSPPDIPISAFNLNTLDLFIKGTDGTDLKILQTCLTQTVRCFVRQQGQSREDWVYDENIRLLPAGLSREEAIIPPGEHQLDGFRLLKEYFHYPARFSFMTITGLQAVLSEYSGNSFELFIGLNTPASHLNRLINPESFTLYCTPAVNLFPRTLENQPLRPGQTDVELRTGHAEQQEDIYSITELHGIVKPENQRVDIKPAYLQQRQTFNDGRYFYTSVRQQKQVSADSQSQYIGSTLKISLSSNNHRVPTDSDENIKTLSSLASGVSSVRGNVQCTNVGPLKLGSQWDQDGAPTGKFICDVLGDNARINLVSPPILTTNSQLNRHSAWDLINLLSSNLLGFDRDDPVEAASQLKALLQLFIPDNRFSFVPAAKQLDAIESLIISPVTERLPDVEPATFVRGSLIVIRINADLFKGASPVVLGQVLDQVFAAMAGINTFTRLRFEYPDGKELYTWPIRTGLLANL